MSRYSYPVVLVVGWLFPLVSDDKARLLSHSVSGLVFLVGTDVQS